MKTDYTPNFDTIVDALLWLNMQGFDYDFKSNGNQTDTLLASGNDFTADYVFRFEGQTDPSDEHIIYAISSGKHHIKGIIVNAFGVYADTDTFALVDKLLPNGRSN